MAKRKPVAQVWLYRHLNGLGYEAYRSQSGQKRGSGRIDWWCARQFERVTGFHLEPGECVPVTIEVKPVAKPKKPKR